MKKVFVVFGALALMLGTSCNEKKTESETTTETTTVIDTVEADGEVNAPDPEAQTETVEESDGTSVSVNSDGVSVNSKDGTNKTNVEVKEGGGTVEIKK
ncbi:MAG TPA: hypothetical protein VF676_03645 [Flavobacterium sp.]|jgi:hypothetical protein